LTLESRVDTYRAEDASAVIAELRAHDFAQASAGQMRALLPAASLQAWAAFAASWNDLGMDTYMADGGHYRRRRFGAFAVSADAIAAKPQQPHYQSRDYNPLNGGVERWFQPLTRELAAHPVLQALLRLCHAVFSALTPPALAPASWHVECHQFRIEARAGERAEPTPEGLHRDGVDWVLVVLVARSNIAEGVTTIYDARRQPLGRFTLTAPLDAAFVDDGRVYHGVTAVRPVQAARPAYRDVLVITFRRA
jgi:hypothetical protein